MNTISYILLGCLIFIVMVTFFLGIKYYFRSKVFPQQAQTIAHETLHEPTKLESQIMNLQANLTSRQEELVLAINKFKDQAHDQDKQFIAKISYLEENLRNIDNIIKKNDSDFNQRFEQKNNNLHDSIKDLMKDLTSLKEESKKLTSLDENVRNLQNIFISSKRQGNLGEYMLETIVNNIYGTQNIWQRQHKLPDGGGIVDMYLNLAPDREGIAIDSKFPLEKYLKNFQNVNPSNKKQFLNELKTDIKNKVRDVSKYVNHKNNLSSIIMFIPSETVFSYIFEEFPQEVIEYSIDKKVWIASPTTLAAILFIVDKHTKEIRTHKNIDKIKHQMMKLFDDFKRLNERWDKLRLLIHKSSEQADDLHLTHRKIIDKYERIYTARELENALPKVVDEDINVQDDNDILQNQENINN